MATLPRSSDQWTRTDPHYFRMWDIEPRPMLIGNVRWSHVRLLSRYDESNASTYLVEVSSALASSLDASSATVEFFVLEGRLSVDSHGLGPGGYAFIPQGAASYSIEGTPRAKFLVFWNPHLPTFPPPYAGVRIVKSWKEPVHNRIPGTYETFYRSLRLPDFGEQGFNGGPGGYVRLNFILPGTTSPVQHVHHECWEESIVLAGDMFIAGTGVAGPGTYVSFPQEFWHAVLATQTGAVILVHTDAPMGFPWSVRPHPVGPAMVEDYLENAPWGRPGEHVSWKDSSYSAWDETPEYKDWRNSREYQIWGGDVGRGVASSFRASWRRSTSDRKAAQP